jgi:hypothetical protein
MKGDLDMSYNFDKVLPGNICEKDLNKIKEAVCIQVEKIYDSCKEKDCIEDAKVLFKCPEKVQWIINHAINVKVRRAEVIKVFSDVEAVPFKRGFFTVDVKFIIKVTLDFFVQKHHGGIKIITVPGVIVFDKKVILFGSEGNVKIFKSHFVEHGIDTPIDSALQQDNLPISKVEVAEPIALNAKICEIVEKCHDCCDDHMPRSVSESLEDFDVDEAEFIEEDDDRHIMVRKITVVTVGLFSIIKLARFVQLLIPAFDFCVPHKKCIASTDEDPCELFETIEFPVDEFFPPQKCDFPGALEEERTMIKE